MATETTAAEPELKTYWCHECDMSVALTSSSPTLLCPHCHTHFLELMDSPFPQNDAVPSFPSALSLFDSPFLHRLLQRHLINTADHNDVVLEDIEDIIHLEDSDSDPLALPSKTASSKTSLPVITVTSTLLTQLDPNGVVFCAVCKDEIVVDAEATQLPCKHLYHSDCITPWLELHTSCPLCRFQLEEEEEGDEDDGSSRAREIRRQLRAAMLRLSELMEEEEDFYGLRTTLNHIASRHGLIDSNESRVNEGAGDLERVSVEREGLFESNNGGGGGGEGGDGQTAVTGE